MKEKLLCSNLPCICCRFNLILGIFFWWFQQGIFWKWLNHTLTNISVLWMNDMKTILVLNLILNFNVLAPNLYEFQGFWIFGMSENSKKIEMPCLIIVRVWRFQPFSFCQCRNKKRRNIMHLKYIVIFCLICHQVIYIESKQQHRNSQDGSYLFRRTDC